MTIRVGWALVSQCCMEGKDQLGLCAGQVASLHGPTRWVCRCVVGAFFFPIPHETPWIDYVVALPVASHCVCVRSCGTCIHSPRTQRLCAPRRCTTQPPTGVLSTSPPRMDPAPLRSPPPPPFSGTATPYCTSHGAQALRCCNPSTAPHHPLMLPVR